MNPTLIPYYVIKTIKTNEGMSIVNKYYDLYDIQKQIIYNVNLKEAYYLDNSFQQSRSLVVVRKNKNSEKFEYALIDDYDIDNVVWSPDLNLILSHSAISTNNRNVYDASCNLPFDSNFINDSASCERNIADDKIQYAFISNLQQQTKLQGTELANFIQNYIDETITSEFDEVYKLNDDLYCIVTGTIGEYCPCISNFCYVYKGKKLWNIISSKV